MARRASSYPAQAAATLRKAQVERAQAALGSARDAHADAKRRLEEARAELGTHRERAPATPGAGGSAMRAAALQREAQFARAHVERRRALEEALERALAAAEAARGAVDEASAALARAHAEAEAVERHRERHERDAALRRDRRGEDD